MGWAAFVKGTLVTAVLHIKVPESNPGTSGLGLPPTTELLTRPSSLRYFGRVTNWKLSTAHRWGWPHKGTSVQCDDVQISSTHVLTQGSPIFNGKNQAVDQDVHGPLV